MLRKCVLRLLYQANVARSLTLVNKDASPIRALCYQNDYSGNTRSFMTLVQKLDQLLGRCRKE